VYAINPSCFIKVQRCGHSMHQ